MCSAEYSSRNILIIPLQTCLLFVGVWRAVAQIIWRDLNQLRRPPQSSLGGT